MRPILPVSLTTPDPTKTAHTWIADASTSGYESAAKAGVSAAAIGAWYCSSRSASSKSTSWDAPKFYARVPRREGSGVSFGPRAQGEG